MKNWLLISSLLFSVSACAAPPAEVSEPEVNAPETADPLLEEIRAAHPVTLSKVAENVWVHTTLYRVPGQAAIQSNGLAVLDGDDVILIDGAWGELSTLALLAEVEEEIGAPVTKMVVTNHYGNRTAGVDAAEMRGVEIFTHPDTPALAFQNGFNVPDTTVAGLKAVGSRTRIGPIEVAYPGPARTNDNLIVYIPAANILYGGDAVRGGEAQTAGHVDGANLSLWPRSLAWVKATYPDTTIVVPGSGKGGDLSLIDRSIQIVSDAASENE